MHIQISLWSEETKWPLSLLTNKDTGFSLLSSLKSTWQTWIWLYFENEDVIDIFMKMFLCQFLFKDGGYFVCLLEKSTSVPGACSSRLPFIWPHSMLVLKSQSFLVLFFFYYYSLIFFSCSFVFILLFRLLFTSGLVISVSAQYLRLLLE